jgi:hypothetical protein
VLANGFVLVFGITAWGLLYFLRGPKEEEMPFGPPLSVRLSPDELEGCFSAYGFTKTDIVDLGYNYMIKFRPRT